MARELYELQGRDDKRFSPFCWRARMALWHKRLEADFIPVQFGQKEKIAFSGQDLVPVLREDDGRVVHDSWTIACYLEDAYGDQPSLFGGAAGRAGARFIDGWVAGAVHPIIARLVLSNIHDNAIVEADQAYFRTSREKRIGMSLEEFTDTSEGRIAAFRAVLQPARLALEEMPYLAGPEPLYADYILFGSFKWLISCCSLVLLAEDDPIYNWYERMLGLFDGFAASDGAVEGQAA
ncbi:MAG: glutathione S-transferase N-terminal domain-containing protein [Proteobacteria bacterium]|nr:glutathione S-transferase N-terminal domain-containing protein [Pseudomonadota bacterium]MDA1356149.1 glutathione S-transferase N-terminal domain-containing protein [Pseudomonadota bacterium]